MIPRLRATFESFLPFPATVAEGPWAYQGKSAGPALRILESVASFQNERFNALESKAAMLLTVETLFVGFLYLTPNNNVGHSWARAASWVAMALTLMAIWPRPVRAPNPATQQEILDYQALSEEDLEFQMLSNWGAYVVSMDRANSLKERRILRALVLATLSFGLAVLGVLMPPA